LKELVAKKIAIEKTAEKKLKVQRGRSKIRRTTKRREKSKRLKGPRADAREEDEVAVGIGGGDELVKAPADDRLLTTMLAAEVLLGSLLGLLDCVLLTTSRAGWTIVGAT
jgi:hypothetical protein